jgi:rhodanese-related sulfurtransferase
VVKKPIVPEGLSWQASTSYRVQMRSVLVLKSEDEKARQPLHLAELGVQVTFPAGARIVQQGETPLYFYLVESGRVRVFRESIEGIRTDLTTLGPGDYFGEVALVTGQPRTASVEAAEETTLIQVSKEEFDRVLDNNPRLARHVIQQLAHWLVAGDRRLETEVVHQVRLRQISWFDFVLLLGLSVILAFLSNWGNPNGIPTNMLVQGWGDRDAVPQISLKDAVKAYNDHTALFVDARPASFYKQKHLKGAKNLPLPLFDFLYLMELSQEDKPLIVYGRNISRHYDLEVARRLILRGHDKVKVLAGGLEDFKGQFPLEP